MVALDEEPLTGGGGVQDGTQRPAQVRGVTVFMLDMDTRP